MSLRPPRLPHLHDPSGTRLRQARPRPGETVCRSPATRPCWPLRPKWIPAPPAPSRTLLCHSKRPPRSSLSIQPHGNGLPPYRLHRPKPEGYAPSHIRLRQTQRFLNDLSYYAPCKGTKKIRILGQNLSIFCENSRNRLRIKLYSSLLDARANLRDSST